MRDFVRTLGWACLAVFCLVAWGLALAQSSQSSQGGQGSHMERRKAGPLFAFLPTVPASLVGAGTLTTTKGVAFTVTRATTKACGLADGGTVTVPANHACVETKGLLVETSSADSVFGPSIALGQQVTMSADVTIKTFGSGYQMALQVQNGGGDRFQLSVGPDGSGRCDYFDGAVRHADEFDSLVTANVKAHLFCSFDGSTLKICVNGTDASHCASAAASITMGSAYVPVVGSYMGSSNFLDGYVLNGCVDPKKCK